MQFRIKAVDSGRAVLQLTVDAGNADSARQVVEHQGLRVLAVTPVRTLASLGSILS